MIYQNISSQNYEKKHVFRHFLLSFHKNNAKSRKR